MIITLTSSRNGDTFYVAKQHIVKWHGGKQGGSRLIAMGSNEVIYVKEDPEEIYALFTGGQSPSVDADGDPLVDGKDGTEQ